MLFKKYCCHSLNILLVQTILLLNLLWQQKLVTWSLVSLSNH